MATAKIIVKENEDRFVRVRFVLRAAARQSAALRSLIGRNPPSLMVRLMIVHFVGALVRPQRARVRARDYYTRESVFSALPRHLRKWPAIERKLFPQPRSQISQLRGEGPMRLTNKEDGPG